MLPVQRIRQQLMKGNYANRIQTGSAVYMAAVLEYLCADILDIVGSETKKTKKQRITPRQIMLAVRTDSELNELLKNVTFSEAGVVPTVKLSKTSKPNPETET